MAFIFLGGNNYKVCFFRDDFLQKQHLYVHVIFTHVFEIQYFNLILPFLFIKKLTNKTRV